mmetsp:Transcript_45441/g.120006  ORF Transcript_45441/g.120006 Transcript_45441/m.120006 type:complete len:352 (+) Transcript_45441:1346-2401(+)
MGSDFHDLPEGSEVAVQGHERVELRRNSIRYEPVGRLQVRPFSRISVKAAFRAKATALALAIAPALPIPAASVQRRWRWYRREGGTVGVVVDSLITHVERGAAVAHARRHEVAMGVATIARWWWWRRRMVQTKITIAITTSAYCRGSCTAAATIGGIGTSNSRLRGDLATSTPRRQRRYAESTSRGAARSRGWRRRGTEGGAQLLGRAPGTAEPPSWRPGRTATTGTVPPSRRAGRCRVPRAHTTVRPGRADPSIGGPVRCARAILNFHLRPPAVVAAMVPAPMTVVAARAAPVAVLVVVSPPPPTCAAALAHGPLHRARDRNLKPRAAGSHRSGGPGHGRGRARTEAEMA